MGTVITTRELNHGGTYVRRGQELECSDTDAQYYVTRNMASYKTRELSAAPARSAPVTRAAAASKTASPPAAALARAALPPAAPITSAAPVMTTQRAASSVPPGIRAAQDGSSPGDSPNDDEPEEAMNAAARRSNAAQTSE